MSDLKERSRRADLPFIDGLRGFAILLVMACHLADHKMHRFQKTLLWELAVNGKYGVALFFVVSAFSLYHSSRSRFLSSARPYVDFYLRRAFRILPAWWLACTAYQLWPSGTGTEFPFGWRDYAMTFGFFRGRHIIFDGDWSIFVEVTFYLLLPLLFLCVRGVIGAVALLILTVLASATTTGLGVDALSAVQWSRTLDGVAAYGPCFAGGILAYFLWSAASRTPLRRSTLLFAECFTWAWLIGVFFAPNGLLPFAFVLLLLLCSSERTLGGRLARMRWLGLFGRCSYSIYLSHLIVFEAVRPVVMRCHQAFNIGLSDFLLAYPLTFLIVTAASLCVGLVGYFAIEKPSQSLCRRLLAGGTTPRSPAACPSAPESPA